MKKLTKLLALILACALLLAIGLPALAAEDEAGEDVAVAETAEEATDGVSAKAWPAAVVVAAVAACCAAGMAVVIAKATGSMARQPEASDKINSAMMLGLVFIETIAIFVLVFAILLLGKIGPEAQAAASKAAMVIPSIQNLLA